MHSDARSLPDGTEVEGDLCIIGAGAAGITIAKEFSKTKHDVVLLEAGGFDLEPSVQSLYEGDNTGLSYFSLRQARLRYFGGSTNHWGGYCSILDPIDLEKRDWIPRSGWPLSLDELRPFYRRAHPLCDLGDYNYAVNYWKKRSDDFLSFPFERSEAVDAKVFKWSTPTQFGEKYRSDITQSKNIKLWTHANVTGIQTSENGSYVTGLKTQCLNGKKHRVKADQYVLACGGLENPRLLLSSNGIGDENGLVGRYFMEHPHIPSARLSLADWPGPAYVDRFDPKAGKAFALLSLSAKKQREDNLLNYTCALKPDRYDRSLPKWAYRVPNMRGLEHYLRTYFGSPPTFTIQSRVEQRPNPNSRVTLSSETDELGQPKIELNWNLTEQEKRTIRVAVQTIAKEVGKRGVGRVQLEEWLTDKSGTWPETLRGGWHHMGTTRMSSSEKKGVVDLNCKVYGVKNLFVAGSSVYPTSGTANPTLTLVALAIRLSDHLKMRISR